MSGLFGVFSFDSERRIDSRPLFRAARSIPHRDCESYDEAGLSWVVQAGTRPASSSEDVEGRVKAAVVGRFDDRQRLADELRRLGHEVGGREAELAVAAYRAWGSDLLTHLTGRFALAVYDAKVRAVLLARDDVGHWPLYYRVGSHDVAFSTRLQTLLDAGLAERVLDPEGAASYFRLGYIPSPRTAVRDVRSLPLGAHAVIRTDRVFTRRHHAVDFGIQDEATSLEDQLTRAESRVESTLRAIDEPSEIWLEPNLPTVVLAAIAGRARGRNVDTVAPDDGDERSARVAHRLGSRHRAVPVSPDLDDLVRLVGVLDQPFADPRWLVRDALGRTAEGLLISDVGARALFAANPRYADALTLDVVRRALPEALASFTPDLTLSLETVVRAPCWPASPKGLNEDFSKTVRGLRGPELDTRADPLAALQAADLRYGTVDAELDAISSWSCWLGVEVVTPYLDRGVIDIASRLPSRGRLEGREVGAGLFRLARRMLPGRLTREDLGDWRPPVGDWMRRELREAAEMAFFGAPGGLSGLLDPIALRRTWYAHQLGWADHGPWLFALFTFELWAQSALSERTDDPGARVD